MKNGYYIRLFYPLYQKQKEDIIVIWKDNIKEDISLRYIEIEKYCEKNECDLMMALFHIYDSYDLTYCFIDLEVGAYDYISEKSMSDFYNSMKRMNLDNQFKKNIMKIDKEQPIKLDYHFYQESLESLSLSIKKYNEENPNEEVINIDRVRFVSEEKNNIKFYIIELIKERRVNPEKYINDKKTKVLISKDSFSYYPYNDLEKLMYIPYEKPCLSPNNTGNLLSENSTIQTQTNSIETTKEEEKQFKTKYTNDELKEIFRKSMEKKLFSDDTRLEDFLYVFGGGDKPKDFNKLDWIIVSKSKQVNKKLLIYYFMKIFNLNCGDVLAPFIQYINNNVIAGENPIVIGGKPDLQYEPEELKGFFLK